MFFKLSSVIHCRKFNVAKKKTKSSKEHSERDEGEFKLERNAKNTNLYWPLWTGFVGQMKRLRMHFTREWLAAILRREIDLRCYSIFVEFASRQLLWQTDCESPTHPHTQFKLNYAAITMLRIFILRFES